MDDLVIRVYCVVVPKGQKMSRNGSRDGVGNRGYGVGD